MRSFTCRQNRGRHWFVCPKNDTSLVFCFRWRGVHLFSSLKQVTNGKNLTFDLYDQGVSAGNPQPPSGDSSEKIDLNKLLITNEIATFFCRVSGRSMEPHMRDGDVLMVDKSIEPKVGKVVIAAINGEMTVKRLSVVDGQMRLTADNTYYSGANVGDFDASMICGVVTNVIHHL